MSRCIFQKYLSEEKYVSEKPIGKLAISINAYFHAINKCSQAHEINRVLNSVSDIKHFILKQLQSF